MRVAVIHKDMVNVAVDRIIVAIIEGQVHEISHFGTREIMIHIKHNSNYAGTIFVDAIQKGWS